MTLYFSPSSTAFFDSSISDLPPDAVEITHQQHVALLAGQSSGMTIGADVDGLPKLVARSLLEQKAALLSAVNTERAKRWRGGFPVLIGGVTKWFHSDEFSLTQHLGLKDKARDLLAALGVMADNITIAGQPVYWSTMDGSQVQITAQVAFDIVEAGALNQALIFGASKAQEAAINAAINLDNYDVLAGWPAQFVG